MAEQPQPLPQGQAPPVQEAPQATPTQTTESAPPLEGSQQIQFTDANGQPVVRTLDQMAEAYRNQSNLTPEQLADFEMYDKAFNQNDPVATKAIIDKFNPQGQTTVPPTPEQYQEALAAMQKRLDTVEGQLGRVTPTVADINTQREVMAIGQVLKQREKEYPFTARHPQGAQLIQQRRTALLQYAQSQGHDPAKMGPELMSQVDSNSVNFVEEFLKTTAAAYGVQAPATAPTGPNVTSVNDQNQNSDLNQIPARFQLGPQGYSDRLNPPPGQPVPGQPLPSQPVVAPQGGMVGVVPEATDQKMDKDNLIDRMRARTSTMGGTV
jgi:hypothetical protein